MGLDIGPATVSQFGAALSGVKTVRLERPHGGLQKEAFAAGTLERGAGSQRSVALFTGASAAATPSRRSSRPGRCVSRIGYVSTAGGAFLEFLEGRELPRRRRARRRLTADRESDSCASPS